MVSMSTGLEEQEVVGMRPTRVWQVQHQLKMSLQVLGCDLGSLSDLRERGSRFRPRSTQDKWLSSLIDGEDGKRSAH